MTRDPVVGDCVVVTRNCGDHGAMVGDRFIVCTVADDDTIRCIPQGSNTAADYWIPCSDIELVTFDWDYARDHLPAEVVPMLTACDGIEFVSLNRSIKEEIFHALPDWRERLLEALKTFDLDLI